MPKEITTYQCTICKTIHDSRFLAEQCEESHEVAIKHNVTYLNSHSKYPDEITIEFSDKSRITYVKQESESTQPPLG